MKWKISEPTCLAALLLDLSTVSTSNGKGVLCTPIQRKGSNFVRNIACILIALVALPCRARIITVDDDAPADFTTIQAAINDANDGDIVVIQPGTYTGDGNRDIDFLGKAVVVTSTDPNDSNTVAATIISGDAFIFQSGEDANSILDGLTITHGSGINCRYASSPTITNCTMTSNGGSAIYCLDASSPTITNCVFASNWNNSAGGAIYCTENCNLVITDCFFADNESEDGGAIYARDSTLIISRCYFLNNLATDSYGGGRYFREG